MMTVRKLASLLVLCGALGGCATTGAPGDPFEPVNRAVFAFNEKADEYVLAPVARGYRSLVPEFLRSGVSNMFSNLEDLWIGVNNILQGKVNDGAQDFARFTWNTTIGMLGFFDVSTSFNLPKHNEDFGQTLGRWGVGTGPYLVLPIFGPSSFRDGLGFSIDSYADYVRNLDNVATRNSLYATRGVNARANLLDAGKVLDEAALDKYRFLRDAYQQRRRSLVYDGNPPREPDDFDDDEKEKPGEKDKPAAAEKKPQ